MIGLDACVGKKIMSVKKKDHITDKNLKEFRVKVGVSSSKR